MLCFDEVMTGFRIAKGCAQVGQAGIGMLRGVWGVVVAHSGAHRQQQVARTAWAPHSGTMDACAFGALSLHHGWAETLVPAPSFCLQEYFGVTPDLTTMGKVIGGGLPVGAYGGKKEIMQMVAPAGPMYQARATCATWLGVAPARLALVQRVLCARGAALAGLAGQAAGWASPLAAQRDALHAC